MRGRSLWNAAVVSGVIAASVARSHHAPRARLPCQAILLRGVPASNPLYSEGRGGVRVFGRKDGLLVRSCRRTAVSMSGNVRERNPTEL